MNQLPGVIGHLAWLIAQGEPAVRRAALGAYNCAVRIQLETLAAGAWVEPTGDRVRASFQQAALALANTALRVHLDERDAKTTDPSLTATLISRAQAMIRVAEKAGFAVQPQEQPAASEPPKLAKVAAAVGQASPDSSELKANAPAYCQEIESGLLDLVAGVAHGTQPSARPDIARTMLNTGAAAIAMAKLAQDAGSVPAATLRHDKLAAQVLQKSS